ISVILIKGWDMHDENYSPKPKILIDDPGYADILAKVDFDTYRRCPFTGVAHFLVDFVNPKTKVPLAICPRSLLKKIISSTDYVPKTGIEFEFFNFKETPDSLAEKKGSNLTALTPGMFGYSVLRPAMYQQYFNDIMDKCEEFRIPLELLHTETGPGVYEAAIEYANTLELADRAHLFKTLTKQIGLQHGVTPCFMAKPYGDQPGCSGHMHFSLQDKNGKNLFADANDPELVSDTLRHFVAGVLLGLPSIMAILAPNVNSYKRLNEAYWAPVTVSYGHESRQAAIRIITPPVSSPSATRIEVRVPGADVNSYLASAAILACGYYGITNKVPLPAHQSANQCPPLPKTLRAAVTKMAETDSLARKVLGDEFVEHYTTTRLHELRIWDLAVTDWELKRYMETA
ncbi:hypothetical protein HDV02_003759, partial [Globomyces sp. JEL0801]